jgi:hypothetical protein
MKNTDYVVDSVSCFIKTITYNNCRRNALGQLKYSNMGKVVKACLALAHGNSDAEKSFSANKRTVSADCTNLNEETVNALRLIKDELRVRYDNDVTRITRNVVTSALLDSARSAYSKYKSYQEEQARQELEEKRKAEVKKGRRQKMNRESRKRLHEKQRK